VACEDGAEQAYFTEVGGAFWVEAARIARDRAAQASRTRAPRPAPLGEEEEAVSITSAAAAALWYPLAHPAAIGHIGSNTGKVLDICYPAGGYQESIRIDGVNTTVERGAAHYDDDPAAGTTTFIRKEPDRLATYVHGRSPRDGPADRRAHRRRARRSRRHLPDQRRHTAGRGQGPRLRAHRTRARQGRSRHPVRRRAPGRLRPDRPQLAGRPPPPHLRKELPVTSQPGEPAYTRGDRVALKHCTDPYTRLQPGDEGTVTRWDPRQGQFSDRRLAFDASELVFHVTDMSVTLTSHQAGRPMRGLGQAVFLPCQRQDRGVRD
jgi:hypothetical protein